LKISKHFETEYANHLEQIILNLKNTSSDRLNDEEELVDVLLRMSTYKPLLGRMWIGWTSFV
jgi:hypothetical protein